MTQASATQRDANRGAGGRRQRRDSNVECRDLTPLLLHSRKAFPRGGARGVRGGGQAGIGTPGLSHREHAPSQGTPLGDSEEHALHAARVRDDKAR